jgi:hypothetical protein
MRANKVRIGNALTAISDTAFAAVPTKFFDVTSWQSLNGEGMIQGPPFVEFEFAGSTTIAITAASLRVGVLNTCTVAGDTFTTTHAAETFTQSAHGFIVGDGPIRLTTDGTLPGGTAVDTDYYIGAVSDANTFKLSTSRANAIAGTTILLSSDGTGTHTYTPYASGNTAYQRIQWQQVNMGEFGSGTGGLLGVAGAGAIALTTATGYMQRVRHTPRAAYYGLVATVDTGTVTVNCRPVWDSI